MGGRGGADAQAMQDAKSQNKTRHTKTNHLINNNDGHQKEGTERQEVKKKKKISDIK